MKELKAVLYIVMPEAIANSNVSAKEKSQLSSSPFSLVLDLYWRSM